MLDYLKYSIDINNVAPETVEIDKILSVETVNAYVPNILVNNALLSYYGRFDYQHFATSLLKMFLKHYSSHALEVMYIYAEVGSFYFVVFRNKKLYYFNRFSYETIEDFLYYILFSIEQLDIDTEQVPIYITGEVDPTALFYSKVKYYVRHIYLIKYHKQHFAEDLALLAPLAADGLLEIGDEQIVVSPKGRLLIRNICLCFDTYSRVQAKQQQFSRII